MMSTFLSGGTLLIFLDAVGGHGSPNMQDIDFEGTLVLEKLAEIGEVDAFFEAVDSDDFYRAKFLMKRANVDFETIALVLKKMSEADGEH